MNLNPFRKLFKIKVEKRTEQEQEKREPKVSTVQSLVSNITTSTSKSTLFSLYLSSAAVRTCVDSIAAVVSSTSYSLEGNKQDIIAAKEFLESPNYNNESYSSFIYKVVSDLLVFDITYIEKVRSTKKMLYELYPRDPVGFTVIQDKYGIIQAYKQTITGTSQEFDKQDIIFKVLHPSSKRIYGIPLIESIADEVAGVILSNNYLYNAIAQDAIPPGFLFLGALGDKSYERIKEEFKATMKSNEGPKVVSMRGDIDPDHIKFMSLKDSSYDKTLASMRELIDNTIYKIFSIPKAETDGSGTLSIYTVQNLAKQSRLIEPLMRIIEDIYNNEVFGRELQLDCKMKLDRRAIQRFEARDVRSYLMSGLQSVNELRQKAGEPAIDGGDKHYIMVGSDVYEITKNGLVLDSGLAGANFTTPKKPNGKTQQDTMDVENRPKITPRRGESNVAKLF